MSLASDIEPEPKYEEYRPNYQHKDRQQFTIKHETKTAYLLSNGIAAFLDS
jgi:hypothetical protein